MNLEQLAEQVQAEHRARITPRRRAQKIEPNTALIAQAVSEMSHVKHHERKTCAQKSAQQPK